MICQKSYGTYIYCIYHAKNPVRKRKHKHRLAHPHITVSSTVCAVPCVLLAVTSGMTLTRKYTHVYKRLPVLFNRPQTAHHQHRAIHAENKSVVQHDTRYTRTSTNRCVHILSCGGMQNIFVHISQNDHLGMFALHTLHTTL